VSGQYELWLTTDSGVRLKSLHHAIWFQASRVVNRIGHMSMRVPWTFDDSLIQPDRMVQIWRAPSGGKPKLWRPYFIRKWRFETGTSGDEFVYLYGVDPNDLLRRRIVAHYAGETNATATAEEADDLMKRIVTDAIADGTNPAPSAGTRAWSDFSVAGDLTLGPQLTKEFAWEQLLTASGTGLLPDIAEAAKEAGTEVFFDVAVASVSSSSISFQFRTYTGQPGMDMTSKARFDKEKALKSPFLEYDYEKEANYVYAGGRGIEDAREVQQVYEADRYNLSKWNRCEGFEYAITQGEVANAVREAGRAALREGRPVRKFQAELVDTSSTRFGLHWDWGDKVRARYRDQEFDAIVRTVVLNVAGEKEQVQARMEYEA